MRGMAIARRARKGAFVETRFVMAAGAVALAIAAAPGAAGQTVGQTLGRTTGPGGFSLGADADAATAEPTAAAGARRSSARQCRGARDCAQVIVCIESKDGGATVAGVGVATGQRRGIAKLTLSDGVSCSGRWSGRAKGGALHVRCADGRRAAFYFQQVDPATGTLIGNGNTNRGEPVHGWMGARAAAYLRGLGAPKNAVPCGGETLSVPVS